MGMSASQMGHSRLTDMVSSVAEISGTQHFIFSKNQASHLLIFQPGRLRMKRNSLSFFRKGIDMFGLGFQEALLIFFILVLLFGAKRLPEIGKGLGRTVKEIRNIRSERRDDKERKKGAGESLISDIKRDIDELPGLKEAREIKDAAAKIKGVTRLLK
jgi:sec-independent protein translocase protein TatA